MDFYQIALFVVVAGVFGLIANLFKQPLLIGYLFAGLIMGTTGIVQDTEMLEILGKIGVTLLLFLLGIEMKTDELSSVGKTALITGLGQVFFTTAVGFLLASLLGFSTLTSVYFGIALAFSSTIIIVKLLSEKKDINSLYGRISVGFLLVQDFIAIAILIVLSGMRGGGLLFGDYVIILIKGFVLLTSVWILAKEVLPILFDKIVSNSTELLFITSIAWALGVAAFVGGPLGFSLEIGGFLAGIALSNLPEHLQIASRTKPLRDFFLTIFFVYLGTHLAVGGEIVSLLPVALLFSLFVLVGNPIIVMMLMGIMRYKKRTSFLAGLTVAQISEFSLIVMAMGVTVGHVVEQDVALIIMVAVITMTISTYMILGAEKIYKRIEKLLSLFERKNTNSKDIAAAKTFKNHVILIGADRTGKAMIPQLKKMSPDFVIVDFNPKVYEFAHNKKLDVVFGDINDTEIIEGSGLDKASLVISTISNYSDNLTLLEHIKTLRKKPVIIITASLRKEAINLYNAGADYVMVPEAVTGDYIKHLLKHHGKNIKKIQKIGKNHMKKLSFT